MYFPMHTLLRISAILAMRALFLAFTLSALMLMPPNLLAPDDGTAGVVKGRIVPGIGTIRAEDAAVAGISPLV